MTISLECIFADDLNRCGNGKGIKAGIFNEVTGNLVNLKQVEEDDDISVDEKNLLETLRKYLSITIREQQILEAKSARFPNFENALHTFDDIDAGERIENIISKIRELTADKKDYL